MANKTKKTDKFIQHLDRLRACDFSRQWAVQLVERYGTVEEVLKALHVAAKKSRPVPAKRVWVLGEEGYDVYGDVEWWQVEERLEWFLYRSRGASQRAIEATDMDIDKVLGPVTAKHEKSSINATYRAQVVALIPLVRSQLRKKLK